MEEQKEEIESVSGVAKTEEDAGTENEASTPRNKLKIGLILTAVVVIITAAILVPVLVTKRNNGEDSDASATSLKSYQTTDSVDSFEGIDEWDWSLLGSPAPSQAVFNATSNSSSDATNATSEPYSGFSRSPTPSATSTPYTKVTPSPSLSYSYAPHSHPPVWLSTPPPTEDYNYLDCPEYKPGYGCSICGTGQCMTNKEALVFFPPFLLAGGLRRRMQESHEEEDFEAIPCGILEELAYLGELNEIVGEQNTEKDDHYCEILSEIAYEPCGCSSFAKPPSRPPIVYTPSYFPYNDDDDDAVKPPVQGSCPDDLSCGRYSCGFTSLGSEAVECCFNYHLTIWNDKTGKYETYCQRSFPIGYPCFDNYQGDSLCDSGICFQGVCSNRRGQAGDICSESRDCQSSHCAKTSIESDATQCCTNYANTYWTGKEYENYCQNESSNGDQCFGDGMCQSGICINGRCAASRLPVGSNCTQASECVNNACGKVGVNATTNECCQVRYTTDFWDNGSKRPTSYCRRAVNNNDECLFDDQCLSGICINETMQASTCRKDRLNAQESCYVDWHCKSRSCGYTEFGPALSGLNKTCCAGRSFTLENQYYEYDSYCAGIIPEGDSCDFNERYGDTLCSTGMCVAGVCATERLPNGEECKLPTDCKAGNCGYDSIVYNSGNQICCQNTIRVYSGGYRQMVCARSLSLGETCLINGNVYNDLCESGICLQGKCAAERLGPGESCTYASDCSNSQCAYSAYDESTRELVCCKGQSIYIYSPYNEYSESNYYCQRSIETGESCPLDNNNGFQLCKSGICLDGKCEDEKLEDGESCSFDIECDNNACALDVMDFDTRSMICCPSGQKVYMYDSFGSHYYCLRNTPLGGQCKSDYQNSGNICESGICIDDICVDKRLNASELCQSNNECKSGACGYNDLDLAVREQVCCDETCSIRVNDYFGNENYCTSILSMGESCEWNNGREKVKFPQLCPTGICVDGICSEELRATGENCTHATECTSGSCGFSSFDHGTDATPKCCGIGSFSIFDGFCDNEDYCQRTFQNGEQCSFRGERYSSLCETNYCTLKGVCGNRNGTVTYEDDLGYHEEEEEEFYFENEGNADDDIEAEEEEAEFDNESTGNIDDDIEGEEAKGNDDDAI